MQTKIIFLTIFVFTINFVSHAQMNGKIFGSIKDGGQQQIIDASAVSLLNAKDSAILKISVTDKEGNFSFENVKDGNYLVLASSIGHRKVYTLPIQITGGTNVSIGTLQLMPETKALKEITIESKKPFIERKIDKTILNVDALISNAGSTAMEVLEKAPGVSVDKDGNISLKGKQGVIIMLDGKPSYLSGTELANLLKNMPATSLEQIEVMTNPSAKYDASGNSGIINLKTKKNKIKGFNGSLTTSYIQGIYAKTNNSINANYRKGKINLFTNYSFSEWNGFDDLSIRRNFRNATTKNLETIFTQTSYMKDRSYNNNLKLGLDFYTDKKTTFGVVISGFINPGKNTGDNTTLLKNSNNQIDSIVLASSYSKNKSTNISANLNFRHTYDSAGTELTADVDYLAYKESTSQMFTNKYFNADMSQRKAGNQLRGDLPANVKIYSAKSDYTMPLKNNSKIEAGIKSSYVITDNNAQYDNNYGNGWVTDYGKTNHFIYKENINAAYLNANKQIKKWGIQTGLRLENTYAQGKQLGNATRSDSSFTRKYTNLFPTVYISFEANKNNTFSVNYGRRIDRPAYQDLNPFFYFLDEYTYQAGNTLLKPQFTNAIELSHTYKGYLTTTLNYSKTNDVFADVLKQINSERKTFLTKGNIASKRDIGIAISAYKPITTFWTANIYVNILNDKYKGILNGGLLNVNSTMFMTNMSNQFKFKKGWSAELSGWYRSKGIEGQFVYDPMWQISTGVQKQVLKNKGSLKLSVSDIFNSQIFTGKVNYQDIDIYVHNKNDRRRVALTFTYRFGKAMQNQQQRRKTGGAEDEQNRVKTGRG